MAIIVNVDVMLSRQKMRAAELAEKVDVTKANISVLKNGKATAIRFSAREAVCHALNCQPGDVLKFKKVNATPPGRPVCNRRGRGTQSTLSQGGVVRWRGGMRRKSNDDGPGLL